METNQDQEPKQAADAKERRSLPVVVDEGDFAMLLDTRRFEHLWRIANMFAGSELVPKHYQGKPNNCAIAIAAAVRLQIDPLMFLQKTYVTQGKPGMEAQLAIALVNARGRLKNGLKYELSGDGDDRGCVAWGTDRDTGEKLSGPRVTIKMAKDEGWYGDKDGMKEGHNGKYRSKWSTMTDLMLQYRAAAFFARVHRPESLLGFMLTEELEDIGVKEPRDVTPQSTASEAADLPPMPVEKQPDAIPTQADPVAQEAVASKPEPAPAEDAPRSVEADEVLVNDAQVKALWNLAREQHKANAGKKIADILARCGKKNSKELTFAEYKSAVKELGQREPGAD